MMILVPRCRPQRRISPIPHSHRNASHQTPCPSLRCWKCTIKAPPPTPRPLPCSKQMHSYHLFHTHPRPPHSPPPPKLLNQRLPHPPQHRHSQRMQRIIVIDPNDRRRRQHRVLRSYGRRVFRGLLDGFHLFFAACVVEGADYDGLAEEDVSC